MELRTYEFVGPSGFKYAIREQNGADEDILSNPLDAKNLMNLTKFISVIVVDTDFTSRGRLTIEDALNLPLNDRYCILFQSRIFSLGEELDFTYDWGEDGKLEYTQDLKEMIFSDYSQIPTEEELDAKPNAIPYYPEGKKLTEFTCLTSSGKELKFDIMTGKGEQKLIAMPAEKQTRNAPLLCRNLQLLVNGVWETVENFSIFSVKDMSEIRKAVLEVDPLFKGDTEISNPRSGMVQRYPVMLAPSFFYLTEE